jgi:hypothetical protein
MSYHLIFLTLLLTHSAAVPALPATGDDQKSGEIRRDMEKSLDLWRDGNFSVLYDRVTGSGSHTKEYFTSHLVAAPRRPSCCWEKLQVTRVTVQYGNRATVQGTFGFDTGAGNEYITRGIKLEREDGIWKMKMTDILSLAGKGKKIRGGKKKAKHE